MGPLNTCVNSRGEESATLLNLVFPGSVDVIKSLLKTTCFICLLSPCTCKLNNLLGESEASQVKLGTGDRKAATWMPDVMWVRRPGHSGLWV